MPSKWLTHFLGSFPPAPAGRQLDVLAYEAGAETSLACDGPLTVARIALPEGAATFTVTGGGTVTARDVNLGPDKGLVVDGGGELRFVLFGKFRFQQALRLLFQRKIAQGV